MTAAAAGGEAARDPSPSPARGVRVDVPQTENERAAADGPKRIQLSRAKGWRKPEGAIVVARPTRFGNPFRVGDPHPIFGWPMHPFETVALYRGALSGHELLIRAADVWKDLRGHDLACWCPLEDVEGNRVPCHADVLLEIANRPSVQTGEQP